MTQKAEALIYSISEMFSTSSKRYMDTLAPLMPKRPVAQATKSTIRPISVFHRAA